MYGEENSLFLRHEWQPENRIFIQGAYIIYSHDNKNHKQRVNLSLAWRQNSLSNFERYAILASGSLSIRCVSVLRGKRVREAKRGNLSFIFLWGSRGVEAVVISWLVIAPVVYT